jgi:hypothetical protein
MDNIRMDVGEVGWGDADWIGLASEADWSREIRLERRLKTFWGL